jgi:peptidoglycan/xylan/chitin deacetylase (PgdA/CDA1 family)
MKEHHLAITVDIEDWYHIPSVTGSPFSVYRDTREFFSKWKGRYDYLTGPTGVVLGLLEEFKVRATFFIVGDVIEHYPGLVEAIAERGHEIGCHGLHHSCKIDPSTKKPLMTSQEFEDRTKKAIRMLEKLTGEKITGYRAPNALIGGWMLDTLEGIGIRYDSSVSVNSLYHKTDSPLRTVSSFPYYPGKDSLEVGERRDIVEFPFSFWRTPFMTIPTSGGPMLRLLGSSIVLRGLKQSLERGHTVFYFHPLDINQERLPAVGRGRPLYWAIKGEIIERRIWHILKSLSGYRTLPLREIRETIG